MKGNSKMPLKGKCYEIEGGGEGWITDGCIALQTGVMKSVPKIGEYVPKSPLPANAIQNLINEHMEKMLPAELKFYYINEPDQCEGVYGCPIPFDSYGNSPTVVFQRVDGSFHTFQQAYVNWITDMEPESYSIGENCLLAFKCDKPVALLMEVRAKVNFEIAEKAGLI